MAQFIKVASTADLAPGEARYVEVAGKKIALFNVEGTFYARPGRGTSPGPGTAWRYCTANTTWIIARSIARGR